MTRQGLGVGCVALLAIATGAAARWPELLTFGLVLALAVAGSLVWVAVAQRVSATSTPATIEVPRLARAAARFSVAPHRMGIVLEDEADRHPRRQLRLHRHDGTTDVEIEFDTARRVVRRHGPLVAVRVDPFGISHRVLDRAGEVHLVVTPRLGTVDDDLRVWNPGDDWEAPRSVRKTHLSEQLREYVVGDEPRRIHWRSSARAGKLMVRERIGTESRDTLVFLDTDPQAWRSGNTFDVDDSAENFELGVELATAVVHQLVGARVQAAFLHGQAEHSIFVDRVSLPAFDRRMAEVILQPTLGAAHAHLPSALRAHRFRRVIVVTFRPGVLLRDVLVSRGRSAAVRLITPMPPALVEHGLLPVESVRWTPLAP